MPDHGLCRKFKRAALAGVLGAIIAAGSIGAAMAEDDDELPDVKVLRHILTGLGLKKPGAEEQIDYRERSPLVVPPTRDLPPPETTSPVGQNPAWPVDSDVKRAAEARKNKRRPVNWEEDARPLSPSQLAATGTTRPAAPSTQQATQTAPSTEDAMKPMKPSELGFSGGFLGLGSLFGQKKQEYAKFEREPPRTELTEPPPGYRTPSPDQPYGLGSAGETSKPAEPVDRAVGDVGTQH